MASEYKNPSEVELNHIVSLGHRNQALLAGDLLKVMDTVSCLSAEKHARLPCVTIMMDDLDVGETQISNGQVLNVKARLTRVFGSSMEVIVDVTLEDIFKSKQHKICEAYFTFVAIAKIGKAKLSYLYPVTMEERLQYALANERRRLRLVARNAAKAKSEIRSKKPKDQPSNIDTKADQITMSHTRVESIELVLPTHANHHQSTFGGQVMAWLVSTCTISASRICDSPPSIVAVNGIQFLGPSSVGDRLVFKSMVNKTFDDKTMEVGCYVEANSIDGETKHINSAYLTFVCYNEEGQRKPLPEVVPTTTEQLQRQTNAMNRCQARADRKKILQHVGPALTIPWTKECHDIIALHNVSTFRKLCQLQNWIEVSREGGATLSKILEGKDQIPCMKVEASFPFQAQHLFSCLIGDRVAWDPFVTQWNVVKKVNKDDSIIHHVLASDDPKEKPLTHILLECRRPATTEEDNYVIVLGCISMESFPTQAHSTGQYATLSGYLITQDNTAPMTCHLTHIAQINSEQLLQMTSELAGESKLFVQWVTKLQEFAKSSACKV